MAFRKSVSYPEGTPERITVLTGVFFFHGYVDHITGIHKANQLEKKHMFLEFVPIYQITFVTG